MGSKLFFLLLGAVFVCYCTASPRDEDLNYLRAVLEDIPDEDRRQFLIHQLYSGYVTLHPNDVVYPVPTEVTLRLYEILLKYFLQTHVDEKLMSTVCFPSGECVDTDDPGIIP